MELLETGKKLPKYRISSVYPKDNNGGKTQFLNYLFLLDNYTRKAIL